MTVQVSKRESGALRKQHRKSIVNAIRSQTRGSGWQFIGQYCRAVREMDGIFVECVFRYTSDEVASEVSLECATKPMRFDPLFWEIMEITGNEAKPLSFRSIGAHTCASLTVFTRMIDGSDIDSIATEFRSYLNEMSKLISETNGSFADRLLQERSCRDHRDRTLFETHSLALLVEKRWEDAESVLRDGLSRALSSHFSFFKAGMRKNRNALSRPFAEMALDWLERNRDDRTKT